MAFILGGLCHRLQLWGWKRGDEQRRALDLQCNGTHIGLGDTGVGRPPLNNNKPCRLTYALGHGWKLRDTQDRRYFIRRRRETIDGAACTRTLGNWRLFSSPAARSLLAQVGARAAKIKVGGSNGEREEREITKDACLFESANGFTGPG